MQAGALSIKLMADIADVQRKMAQMQQLAQTASNGMASAFSGLGAKIAGALSVGAIAAFVKQTVDAIDAMNDLADATGASIEEISKLDQVARRNGQSLDQVGGMLVKFNAALKEADGKNGASIALQAIGLEAAKLRQTDPAEALRQTAVALAGFADDGNKARIVQELFGKSVRDAAPFLKDLAEAGELNASVTAQQAAEAEKFNKAIFQLQAQVNTLGRGILNDLLPTLTAIAQGFAAASQESDRYEQSSSALRVPLEALAILGANVAFVFQGVGREIGAWAAQIAALARGDLRGFTAISDMVKEDGRRASAELDAFEQRVLNAGKKVQQALQSTRQAAQPGLPDIVAEQARRKAADEAAIKAAKDRQTELDIQAKRQLANIAAYDKAEQELEEQLQRTLKAELDLAAARGLKAVAAYEAAEQAIDDSLAKARDLVKAINSETAALGMSNQEREIHNALLSLEAAGLQKGTYAYEEYARKIREAVVNRETVRASIEQTKTIEEEWRRTADQIGQSLTDALMTGGKSAWEYIKGLFRSMVLRPIVQAVVNPIVGATQAAVGSALGLSAGSAAAGSAFGNAAGAAIGSAIFGSSAAYGAAIGTTSVAAGSQAAMLAAQTGSFGAAGLTATSSAAAGAGSGFMATAAAAGPYVLAALAVLNAAGVFRSKKIVGGGLTGTLGEGDIQSYDLQRRGGTLFSGPDYSMVNQRVSAESQAIQTAYEALRTNAVNMAEALGLSSDAVKTFTTTLGTDITQNDIGTRGIKLDGLTPEEAAQKVQAALNQANEDLAAFVLGASRTVTETITTSVEDWAEGEQGRWMRGYVDQVSQVSRTIEATGPSFARTGETAVQTLTRLASSISTINPVLELLGLQLFDTSLAGAELASTMADAFGGLENFTRVTAQYYQEFFSEAERTAHVTAQLTEALGGMGMTLPTTRDAFRDLVEAQDLTTEAGRKNFATLMQLSGTFAAITPVLEQVTEAGETVTETLRSAADILNERQGLERQLLQLQGDTTALRALERAALHESNRARYDEITALQDSQAAAAAAAESERTLAAEREKVAQERAGLERQLLQLQGDTTALRALDRAALDASNRAMFDQIMALQDSQAATAAAAESERALATEREKVAQERAGLERQLLQLQGDTTALRALERAALQESNRARYDEITALQDSQAAAAAAAESERTLAAEREKVAQERAGLERQLLQLQGDTTALRALERAALHESNRARYDEITALQDSQAAAAAAAQAQRDYTAAVEAAQAAVERARSAVASAESGVAAVREQATSAYISAQDRVAAANARIADLNAGIANAARDAALRVQELGTSLQEFVHGQFATPSQNFGTLLRRALGGDSEAMQGLPEAARAAIDVSRASARTTAQAAMERARILSSVAEVAAVAAATALPEGAAAADPMLQATQELAAAQAELVSALGVANQLGAPLTREVQDLVAKFTAAQGALTLATTDLAAAEKALADIVANTAGTVTAVNSATTAIGTLKTAFDTAKNTLDVQLKAVADSNLPDDIKTLIADKGKTYQVTIGAVMASTLTDAQKTLLLEASTTGMRAVTLGAAFGTALTAEQRQALMVADETILRTIQAAVTAGTLTDEQRLLLTMQKGTVDRTVNALVNSASLTTEQRAFLNLVTGATATGATVTISGAVTFDPGNALQSIFNNISKSNALLAKMALAQLGPTATAQQKATTYGAFRELYTDAQTRAIVETAYGRQTDADWAVLKSLAGFANGGVFTNGIVSQPTLFNMAQMGEAGPEAIMPLSRGADGSLGVNLWGSGARRDEALVAEIRALRQEMTELRAEARSTAVATNKTARILDRVTPDGNSLQTVAAV